MRQSLQNVSAVALKWYEKQEERNHASLSCIRPPKTMHGMLEHNEYLMPCPKEGTINHQASTMFKIIIMHGVAPPCLLEQFHASTTNKSYDLGDSDYKLILPKLCTDA